MVLDFPDLNPGKTKPEVKAKAEDTSFTGSLGERMK
jgi:hypothetical protein